MPKIVYISELTKDERAEIARQIYGEWTIDPPTETGLYWAFNGEVCPVEVYLDGSSRRLVVFELGDNYDQPQDVSDFSHWLGPLPEPEPPK